MKKSILLTSVLVFLVTLFSPTVQAQRPNNPTGSETTTSTTPTRGTATRTTRPSANRGTTTRPSASNRGTRTTRPRTNTTTRPRTNTTPRPRTNTTPRPRTNTTPRPRTNDPNYCPPGGNARTSNGSAQSTRRTGGSFGTQAGSTGRGTRVGTRTRPSASNRNGTTTTRVRTADTRGKKIKRSRRANRTNEAYDEVYGAPAQKVEKANKAKVSASRRNK